jgi:hypothetical protein
MNSSNHFLFLAIGIGFAVSSFHCQSSEADDPEATRSGATGTESFTHVQLADLVTSGSFIQQQDLDSIKQAGKEWSCTINQLPTPVEMKWKKDVGVVLSSVVRNAQYAKMLDIRDKAGIGSSSGVAIRFYLNSKATVLDRPSSYATDRYPSGRVLGQSFSFEGSYVSQNSSRWDSRRALQKFRVTRRYLKQADPQVSGSFYLVFEDTTCDTTALFNSGDETNGNLNADASTSGGVGKVYELSIIKNRSTSSATGGSQCVAIAYGRCEMVDSVAKWTKKQSAAIQISGEYVDPQLYPDSSGYNPKNCNSGGNYWTDANGNRVESNDATRVSNHFEAGRDYFNLNEDAQKQAAEAIRVNITRVGPVCEQQLSNRGARSACYCSGSGSFPGTATYVVGCPGYANDERKLYRELNLVNAHTVCQGSNTIYCDNDRRWNGRDYTIYKNGWVNFGSCVNYWEELFPEQGQNQ